jgi:tripartite-type tricarboxylate transporter receptor subunit TctC
VAFDEKAVGDFYRGKTIRIIIGFAPGSSFDVYARLLAKYMPQYIPGNPTIVVENKPGAGSMLAANAVYTSEPKDGTAIVAFDNFSIFQQLLGAEGVNFDFKKFQWLGATGQLWLTCVAHRDSPNIQEVMSGKEFKIGTSGPGAASHSFAGVLKGTLGPNIRLITGYDGIAKLTLGVESKEIDGFCTDVENLRPLLEGPSPTGKVLLTMGEKEFDDPLLKGAPVALSLAQTDEAKLLLRTINAPSDMNRPYALAPEVPSDRVQALRKAFDEANRNPELIEEAKQAKLRPIPVTADQVSRVVDAVFGLSPDIVARLKTLVS